MILLDLKFRWLAHSGRRLLFIPNKLNFFFDWINYNGIQYCISCLILRLLFYIITKRWLRLIYCVVFFFSLYLQSTHSIFNQFKTFVIIIIISIYTTCSICFFLWLFCMFVLWCESIYRCFVFFSHPISS